MWGKLKTKYRIQVKRDTVLKTLREEDPEETLKKNQGQLFEQVMRVMQMKTTKSNHTVFPYMLA